MEALTPLVDAVRPLLQPVTHNLPEPIRDLGISLIGDKCYKTLLLDIDHTDEACLKLGISKALGIAIVTASSIVKVPQILKLMKSKSSEGVSIVAYTLETLSYMISMAYSARKGFPFSTYGETALILAQNVVISVLLLWYSGKPGMAGQYLSLACILLSCLWSPPIVSMENLVYMQAGAGALSVASKLPQIITIFSSGTTGQLSAFTVFNYLIGSLTRIFTTIQEVDDKTILYSFIAGFVLNVILALQMVIYWNKPATKAKKPISVTTKEPISKATTSGASIAPKKGGPTTRRRG
ncbi:hypothetical protein TD95_002423 [Thielaviopsis punctulata]|uniref:Mannose-P-dolichol utilization defect 1 protein homolog n=1 Tax=Thielaviopsis punctulata TaxID=72032 RepID=A0A0F4ZDQ6_9PEZI|nr:hypothetical protein TD95_002423 [Thielaviopsis punctulata]